VLLLKLSASGEEALDDEQDLLLRPMSPILALGDDLSELWEEHHVVVLEYTNDSAKEPQTDTDQRVVEFVGGDEVVVANQSRDDGGAGREAHA
jgi:hypothetical protein